MSTATSVTFQNYGSAWEAKPFLRGWQRSMGTAVIPSGNATCTITNIPNLVNTSEILISQHGVTGATAKLIEISSGRTNGAVGTITVGTLDGSTVTGDSTFSFQIVNQ